MLFYILKRFLQMVIVIAIVGTIVFIFVNMLGDPAVLLLPPEASPEELAKAKAVMGLDKSTWEQYKIFQQEHSIPFPALCFHAHLLVWHCPDTDFFCTTRMAPVIGQGRGSYIMGHEV